MGVDLDNNHHAKQRRLLLRQIAWSASAALIPHASISAAELDLDGSGMPYAAFEQLPIEDLAIGNAHIHIAFGPGGFQLPHARIIDYVRQSAQTVALYFGRFPARSTRLLVLNSSAAGRPVRSGMAFGYQGAAIKLTLAASVSAADLDNDWILVHEMCHLALPSLPRQQGWFEEGMASYVEPLARAQAGLLSAERVWGDLVKGLPQGLPQAGDRGLDHTPTWGRRYWGGALFCLLADVGIREASAGRSGLQQALRAILDHGNIEDRSALEPLLRIGDGATKTTVLTELHAQMGASPYPVDLDQWWARLGVRGSASAVEFDDAAPLAAIRLAMTRRL
ncbi:MAG: hypothetical protein ABI564_02955 [Ideonella sp.]